MDLLAGGEVGGPKARSQDIPQESCIPRGVVGFVFGYMAPKRPQCSWHGVGNQAGYQCGLEAASGCNPQGMGADGDKADGGSKEVSGGVDSEVVCRG